MHEFNISEKELKTARDFFSGKDIKVLTAQCVKINQSQPNFSAVVLALEIHGLDQSAVEDILESIFVIYYAQTELRQKTIKQISFGQIRENIKLFEEFLKYYNDEKQIGSDDLLSIKFIRDNVVLEFALNTLRHLFINSTEIPKEVLFSYFSLLKAIEIGALKDDNKHGCKEFH